MLVWCQPIVLHGWVLHLCQSITVKITTLVPAMNSMGMNVEVIVNVNMICKSKNNYIVCWKVFGGLYLKNSKLTAIPAVINQQSD